jgi:hypothetical protein
MGRANNIPFRPSKITNSQVESLIAREEYWHVPNTATVVCALILSNGYTVTGEASAADPDAFDEELGRYFAKEKARERIWRLEAYLLRERLVSASVA